MGQCESQQLEKVEAAPRLTQSTKLFPDVPGEPLTSGSVRPTAYAIYMPPNESRRKSFLSQSIVTSFLHLAGYFFLFIFTLPLWQEVHRQF